MLTSCGHCTKKNVVLTVGQPFKNYDPTCEWECPICSKPASIKVPVFSEEVRNALEQLNREEATKILKELDCFLYALANQMENFKQTIFMSNTLYDDSSAKLFNYEASSAAPLGQALNSKVSLEIRTFGLASTPSEEVGPLALVPRIFKSLLDYIPVCGLKEAVKRFGRVYSNLLCYHRVFLAAAWSKKSENDDMPEVDIEVSVSLRLSANDLLKCIAAVLTSDCSQLPELFSEAVMLLVASAH